MKRLHNRFILGGFVLRMLPAARVDASQAHIALFLPSAILRDSMKAELPRRHVPEGWLPRGEGGPGAAPSEDDFRDDASRLARVRAPSNLPSHPAPFLAASSHSAPGVLEVEPAMRREAAAAGLPGGASPGAVRAMTAAAGIYVAALLGGLCEGRRAVEAGARDASHGDRDGTALTSARIRRDVDSLIASSGFPQAYLRAASEGGAGDPAHGAACIVAECICAAEGGEDGGGRRKRGGSADGHPAGGGENGAKRPRGEAPPRRPSLDRLSDSERTAVTSNQSSGGGRAGRAGPARRPPSRGKNLLSMSGMSGGPAPSVGTAGAANPGPAGPGPDAAGRSRERPPTVEEQKTSGSPAEVAGEGAKAEEAEPGRASDPSPEEGFVDPFEETQSTESESAEEQGGFVDPFKEDDEKDDQEKVDQEKADGGDESDAAFVDPFEGDEPDERAASPAGKDDGGKGRGGAGGPSGDPAAGGPPRSPGPAAGSPGDHSGDRSGEEEEEEEDDDDALCGSHMQSPTQSSHFAALPPASSAGGGGGGASSPPPLPPQFIPRGKILAGRGKAQEVPGDGKGEEEENEEDGRRTPSGPAREGETEGDDDDSGGRPPSPKGPPPSTSPPADSTQQQQQQQAIPAKGRGLKGKNLAAMRARKAAAGGDEQARREEP